MSGNFPWKTAARIAWRESRASAAKFGFVVMAVAVGVGSLTGVRGFSEAFRGMLLKDARKMMAADMTVRVFEMPDAKQDESLARMEELGARRTWITETVSMVSAESMSAPILVAVKGVDPERYPFYGEVELAGGRRLREALEGGSVVVSDDLLVRTGVKVGDRVRLGAEEFRIADVIVNEPDRMSGSINVGPRVMLRRENMQRAGLLEAGSRSSQRFLFQFPAARADAMIQGQREMLKRAFPDGMIADYRETHPLITRGLNNSTTFLSLVSLIALVVGALGVAMAMQSHLQQRMDAIAVMKSLGGRSAQILRIFLLQALGLAAAGGVIGVALGGAVQKMFPWLIRQYFPVAPEVQLSLRQAGEGMGLAILGTLLFVLPPLLGIRDVKPVLIFRRDMDAPRAGFEAQWMRWRAALGAGAMVCLGIAGMAAFLIDANWRDAARVGGWFVGGMVVSLLLLAGLSWLLLRGLRGLLRGAGRTLPALARHGLANLYRPGNRAEAVLVAFSLGVMFTLTVYLLQSSLLGQIAASAPPGMPNVFVINITAADRDQVAEFLRTAPGVEGEVNVTATAAGHLKQIDGKVQDQTVLTGSARRYLRARTITWAQELPKQTEVVEGDWWGPKEKPAEAQISVLAETANLLGIRVGSIVDWEVSGRAIRSRVVALHRNERVGPGSNAEFVFSPGALDNVPVLYFGGVRARPAEIAKLQKASFEKFPAITMINMADVLDQVQQVIDQVALVVRFISAFAILAGVIILASSIAGSRMRRVREVVILKTLGATRQKVAAIFSVEFLLLGLVAGVMGSVLAVGFTNMLLTRLLDARFQFEWAPNLISVAASALIANAAGWAASYRILDQKPLEILREE